MIKIRARKLRVGDTVYKRYGNAVSGYTFTSWVITKIKLFKNYMEASIKSSTSLGSHDIHTYYLEQNVNADLQQTDDSTAADAVSRSLSPRAGTRK